MSAPSYKANDPRGWCGDPARGAALGRASIRNAPPQSLIKLHVRRIHIDQEGYDENGTYWGGGEPLYWFAAEDGEVDMCLRARDRDDAIVRIGAYYPKAEIAPVDEIDPGFLAAYIEAALWSSNDSDDNPLDANHSDADLAPETLAAMRADCETFQRDNAATLARVYAAPPTSERRVHVNGINVAYDAESAGHDFWLTRNGHGCGFWDRDLGELGDELTKACKKFGECNLFVGDDGKIYLM